jgi:hypothetical protein
MRRSTPAANPDAYVAGLGAWQRLLSIERRLEPGGKYEMATLVLREGQPVSSRTVRRLTKEAVTLNKTLGDPTRVARPGKGG